MNEPTKEFFTTRAPEETWRIAEGLLPRLAGGAVVALHGDLGAGKTTFTQGLAIAMGVANPVASPTFALCAEHRGTTQRLIHLDLYRMGSPEELLEIGFLDFTTPPNIVVVEWPERAGALFPATAWHVWFETGDGPNARRVKIEAPH